MKVIDAFWEKRNLGVTTCEVTFEVQDLIEDIDTTYNKLLNQYEYRVFRVPTSRCDISLFMQSKGCRFMETAITLQNDLADIYVKEKYKAFCNKCSWELMTDDDLIQLYAEIRSGIFQTDRIYLDPYFSKEVAANRYVFWIQDLVEQNCLPHKVMFGDKVIGFFLNKSEGTFTRGLLAGVYQSFLKTGMGFLVQYAGIACAKAQNFSCGLLNVSSNNLPVVKINMELGAKIKTLEYVLVQH